MNHIKLIPTFQRKKSIPKQLKDLELRPLNEQFSKLTMPIISDDDLRPVMMGNFFDMESKKIVSTDAHKLTAINMPKETYNFIKQTYNKELDKEPKGLIFRTLSQLQKDYNELLKIGVNENTGLQSFSEYAQRRIIEDGRYPNYDAVIPREFTNQINVDYQKLYWYVKVLLDAKVIDDKNKLNSSNETEYQNKKIEYLKDSYVSFINTSTRQIILTYILDDGTIQYIGFNAKFLCDILRFAMEYNGKYFGKVGISGNSRAMVIELENGLNATNDSIGLIMPIMLSDNKTIGDIDFGNAVEMYYDLDTNSIISDKVNYPIDESIGFKGNKESLSIPKIRVDEKVTTEITSDNSYIDDINIDNKILIVEEKGKPLSTYKNGDKVFFADYSADKNWKLYVEGEVFVKDNEYSIKRFPQNITFKKYPLATFNSNTKVALKPNNEPIYSSDKTIKNNGVKNTQNDSMTFITNRIKGLKIALKVARAENKPKIQKRILGLEIAKKMQPKKMNKGGVVFTNYNGSEIMYEPNYDEYFVNDEVFDSMESAKRHIDYMAKSNGVIIDYYNGYDINIYPKLNEYWVNDEIKFNSMEDAKNYIDTGEMENDSYGFGGGLLVGSLVGSYLGYKVGKYNKQVVSSGFQTEKLIGKDIKNKLQGKKTYAKGGGVAESMHFFVVIDKNDKNYNRVGYVFYETETIFDKDGNEFEKLNFENQKVAKKYNVKDLIYLEKRDTFTQKDKYGGSDTEYVILVNYQYSSKPFDFYYYLYNVTKKFVATEGNLDWVKSNLPRGFKVNSSYAGGGGVDGDIKINDNITIKGNKVMVNGTNGFVNSGTINEWFKDSPKAVKEVLNDKDENGEILYKRIAESDNFIYYTLDFEDFNNADYKISDVLDYYAVHKASGRGGDWEIWNGLSFMPLQDEFKYGKLNYQHPSLKRLMKQDSYYKNKEKYDNGGGVDTISDEDLLRIKLAVAEAQDRINANDTESNSDGGIEGITNFIKENPELLLMLKKGGKL